MKHGLGSIRWGALLFSVPYTLLWSAALIADGRDASAILLVIAHGAALLCGFAWSDKVDVSRGVAPRLSALPRPTLIDSDPPAFAVAILAFLSIVPALVLLLIDWRVGAAVFVVLIGLALLATSPRRRKMTLAEVLLPLVTLVAPALIIGAGPRWRAMAPAIEPDMPESAPQPETTTVVLADLFPDSVTAATWLGAIIFGLIILLCAQRDRARDVAAGLRTTATKVGATGAGFLAALWLAATVTLAAMGAGWGWWHWSVGALVALIGAWSAGAMSRTDWRAAALRWTIGHAPIAVALALSAG